MFWICKDRRCCSLASSRVEVCDLDVLAELISILMGRLASWSDRDLQNAIAARTEEIIRFDDLIELEIVRQQRRRIKALRLHHCHQSAHPFLPAGAKGRHDLVIADSRCKCVVRHLEFALVNAEAAERSAGAQTTQAILKRLL